MMDFNTFCVDKIIINPYSGARIVECVREAVILAMQEFETVEFEFNGKTYKVEPDALIRFIVEGGYDE